MSTERMAAVRTRADVLPGFVLATPPFLAAANLEEELNRRAELRYVGVRLRQDPLALTQAVREAEAVVDARPYPAYGKAFLKTVFTDRSFTPHLLRACLLRHHPGTAMNRVRELLAENDDAFLPIRDACLDLFDVGPVRKRRRRLKNNGSARDGIHLDSFILALLKQPGVTWRDTQELTLTQAMLLLFGDTSGEEFVQEARLDGQVRFYTRLAAKHGLTLRDFGRMGAEKFAAWTLEHTGKVAPLDQVYALLEQPEFCS